MDMTTLLKLHDIADNMILGNMELAYKELGDIIKGSYKYCLCEVATATMENMNFCIKCNKVIDLNFIEGNSDNKTFVPTIKEYRLPKKVNINRPTEFGKRVTRKK